MTILLQVSDAHFGTERAAVLQALQSLAAALSPDVVVFSGDITQRARRSQFSAARAFADTLQARTLLAIPGNHDIPLFNLILRLFAPYANYAGAFGANLEPEFEAADLLVIGVNTTRPRRHKDGEISRPQIERVAARLHRSAPAQLRIVLLHHPAIAIRASDVTNLVHGREEAIPTWAAAGADIIMGGHIHLPYVVALRASFPSLVRDMWTVQAGTAVSSRIREGISNSVNVVRCGGYESSERRCTVERWTYSSVVDQFELETTHALVFLASVDSRQSPTMEPA